MSSKVARPSLQYQRADKGAGAKRARYNSSLIDSNILPAGFEVENFAETYVSLKYNEPIDFTKHTWVNEDGSMILDNLHETILKYCGEKMA